jgi:hypothetical protein
MMHNQPLLPAYQIGEAEAVSLYPIRSKKNREWN